MNKQQAKSDFSSIFANIGIYALFIIYPFVMNNGYHDITVTRYTFFCLTASVCAVICAVCRIFNAKGFSLKQISFRPMTTAVFAFFVFSALSTVFSEFPIASVYGDAGRHMGFLMYIALCVAYFWISSCYRVSERDFEIFSFISAIIFIFSFLQFRGFDIFGLMKTMPFESRINFLSPFGNINVFSGYICLIAPFSMYMCIFSVEKIKRVFWTLCSVIGFLSLFIANSDSGYLGIATAFIVLFLCSCRTSDIFSRYWYLAALFFLSAAVFGLFNRLFPGTRGVSDMTMAVTESVIPLIGLAVAVIILLFVKKRKSNIIPKSVNIAFIAVISLTITVIIGAMIYFSVVDKTAPLGFFEKFLRFNDAWGTERGFVWSRLWKIFADAPLKNKLFGFGAETVSVLMIREFKDDMLTLGYFSDNAHNEYLNLLISNGLCGLISYIIMLVIAIKSTLRKNNPAVLSALLLPVAAWSVQAVVNITQPISTPFIFIFIALTQCHAEDYSLLTKINIKRFFPAKSHIRRKEDDTI